MKNLKEQIKEVVKIGNFTLTSGKKSDFYIDIKSLLLKPEFLTPLAQEIYNIIVDFENENNIEISAIGGMELGSVPISTAVCLASGHFVYPNIYILEQFIIRKNKRNHGTQSQIEGLENIKDKHIILVDDVLTTGGSLIKAYNIVSEYANVVATVVIVDREETELLETFDTPIIALFKKKDLM